MQSADARIAGREYGIVEFSDRGTQKGTGGLNQSGSSRPDMCDFMLPCHAVLPDDPHPVAWSCRRQVTPPPCRVVTWPLGYPDCQMRQLVNGRGGFGDGKSMQEADSRPTVTARDKGRVGFGVIAVTFAEPWDPRYPWTWTCQSLPSTLPPEAKICNFDKHVTIACRVFGQQFFRFWR